MGRMMFIKVSSDFYLIRVGLGTEKLFQLRWNQKQKDMTVDILLSLNKQSLFKVQRN